MFLCMVTNRFPAGLWTAHPRRRDLLLLVKFREDTVKRIDLPA